MSKWVQGDPSPVGSELPGAGRRRLAIAAGLATTFGIPIVVIPIFVAIFGGVNSVFHPGDGNIWGYNTGERGAYAVWSFFGLCIAAGFIVYAIIIDPSFGTRTEISVVVALFLLTLGVSEVNFLAHDSLMMLSGQAALDVLLSVLGLSLV
jgi:hypothetical protein